MEEEAAWGSSSSESRIVRCPDCGNVLPELPDFSVSLCGSCGAVLRAKWKGHVKGGLPDISDDEKGRVVTSKRGIAMGSNSVSETEGNRKLELGNCSTSRSENGDFLARSGKRNPISVRTRVEKSTRDRLSDRDEYGSSIDDELDLDDWACRNDARMDIGDGRYGSKLEEIGHPRVGPFGSRIGNEKWGGERNGNAMDVARQKRGMNFAPLEEGSLEYVVRSSYGAGDYRRYHDDGFNGFTRVADLESDRAELLRRIDELKDQLSQTCDVAENPKERIAIEPRMASKTPFDPYRSHDVYRQGLFGANKQPRDQGCHVLGPPYIYDVAEDVPYKGRHGSIVQDSYSVMRYRHGKVEYDNAYYEQVNTRAYQPYPCFPQMYHNEYPDPLRLHPHKSPFHRPSCSCSQCFNQNPKVSPLIPPPAFGNQRSHDPANPVLYPPEISAAQNQHWHRRGLGGHAQEKFEIGHQSSPRKAMVAHESGRVCRAISGGAPFIACCNCFELLKLPWKVGMMGKNQNKMRCGACSCIMLYELSSKGITLSVPKQISKLSADLADDGSGDMPNESFENSHGSMNPCSNYDDHSYEFSDTKVEPLPANLKSSSDESEKRQDARSLSSNFSEPEKNPEVMVGKDHSLSDVPLPLSNSPLHHNHVSSDDVGDGYIMVSKWSSENEGQQNSMEDAPVETVMDISINESINSSVSQEFFAGLVKSRAEELSKSNQNSEDRRSNVFVNGQLIPACEVKRAEDLAGPIQIGDYWYDVRAGFWGVMGHPCLGIIPPNIPEFDFPMPKNCAAGNTGVFVNGRELHHKDLNLLSSRGLPTTKNKSYRVEISGKVMDEQTGEELESLGKLAPTVERAKHGFGMKIPKFTAEKTY
nr:protein ENHANCED DISEASE RESISTANCE 4-like [Ipomoea batatas]